MKGHAAGVAPFAERTPTSAPYPRARTSSARAMASTCSAASTGSSGSPSWHASITKSALPGSRTSTASLSTRSPRVEWSSASKRPTESACVVVIAARYRSRSSLGPMPARARSKSVSSSRVVCVTTIRWPPRVSAVQSGPTGSGAAKTLPCAGIEKPGGATTTACRIVDERAYPKRTTSGA